MALGRPVGNLSFPLANSPLTTRKLALKLIEAGDGKWEPQNGCIRHRSGTVRANFLLVGSSSANKEFRADHKLGRPSAGLVGSFSFPNKMLLLL